MGLTISFMTDILKCSSYLFSRAPLPIVRLLQAPKYYDLPTHDKYIYLKSAKSALKKTRLSFPDILVSSVLRISDFFVSLVLAITRCPDLSNYKATSFPIPEVAPVSTTVFIMNYTVCNLVIWFVFCKNKVNRNSQVNRKWNIWLNHRSSHPRQVK